MNQRLISTAAFLAMGLSTSLGYTAVAQQTPSTVEQTQPAVNSNRANNRVSAADRQFMIAAAQLGIAEVTLSRLAVERAATDEARQYAQQMIEQHTQANSELMSLAAEKGVKLPTTMDAKHQALRARLGQIPGRRFDETYLREMTKDHNLAVAMFQRQSQRGQDADIKTFAANKLPSLREHWQMARTLSGNVARGNVNNSNKLNNPSNQNNMNNMNNMN